MRSQLGQNNIEVINIYALSVIGYSVGIITWSKEEMEIKDIKTKKLRMVLLKEGKDETGKMVLYVEKILPEGPGLTGFCFEIECPYA